jgi:hypothetical protein
LDFAINRDALVLDDDRFLAFSGYRPYEHPRALWSFGRHDEMGQPLCGCRLSEGDEDQVKVLFRINGLKSKFREPIIPKHKLPIPEIPHRCRNVRSLEQLIEAALQLAAGSEGDVCEIVRVERASGPTVKGEDNECEQYGARRRESYNFRKCTANPKTSPKAMQVAHMLHFPGCTRSFLSASLSVR